MKAKLFFTSILAAFIGFCLLIVGVCTVSTVKTQSAFAATTGEGTEENPYVVTSLTELNEAMDSTTNEINYIRLDGNISSSGTTVTLDATDKEMVLDLDGFAFNGQDCTVGLCNGGTIKNGTINGNMMIEVADYSGVEKTATLEGLTFTNSFNKAVRVLCGTLNINNCNIDAERNYAIWVQGRAAKCTATNVQLSSRDGICLIEDNGTFILDGVTKSTDTTKTYHTHKDEDNNGLCDICDETFTPATDDVNDKANDKGGDGEGCGSSLGFGLAGLALAVLLVAVTKKKEA